ncbi:hypothetical protein Tco_1336396 [Tanacetum coccineum]
MVEVKITNFLRPNASNSTKPMIWRRPNSKDIRSADGLREEVARFVGSGVESFVWKLLSSDEFHAALAHIASLGINYGVEKGLCMRRTLSEMTQILPDKHIRPVTSAPVAPSIANDDADQVPLEHASDDLVASI